MTTVLHPGFERIYRDHADLAAPARLLAALGSAAPARTLAVRAGCPGAEVGCAATSGEQASHLDVSLAAGTYYLFVDAAAGEYNLDVTLSP